MCHVTAETILYSFLLCFLPMLCQLPAAVYVTPLLHNEGLKTADSVHQSGGHSGVGLLDQLPQSI